MKHRKTFKKGTIFVLWIKQVSIYPVTKMFVFDSLEEAQTYTVEFLKKLKRSYIPDWLYLPTRYYMTSGNLLIEIEVK